MPDPFRFLRYLRPLAPTLRYWMVTEVHVYAFSIAANVLLSFFPFLIVMNTVFRDVLHWQAAAEAVNLALQDYLPDAISTFVRRNLPHRGPQLVSLLLLLFTANGIFEPLEVAFNRVWNIPKNRSFLRNQLVSLGLILACGGLALLSTTLTAVNQEFIRSLVGDGLVARVLGAMAFKTAAIPLLMLALFLIYWLLPNGRIPPARVVPAAILAGLLIEVLKYLILLTWPWLSAKLQVEYGPFHRSAAILIWAFFGSLLILAGAEFAARMNPFGTKDEKLVESP